MSETNQEREGRVTAERVLENLICGIETEMTQLYTYMYKDLRDMNRIRLERDLKDAKDALEWAKGRGDA